MDIAHANRSMVALGGGDDLKARGLSGKGGVVALCCAAPDPDGIWHESDLVEPISVVEAVNGYGASA